MSDREPLAASVEPLQPGAPTGPAAGLRLAPLEAIVLLGGLAVAGLSLAGLPGLWRFNVAAVPGWVFPAATIVAFLGALFALSRLGHGAVGDAPRPAAAPDPVSRARALATTLVVCGAAGAVLWVLRCRKPYGDAGAITGFITQGVVFHKREPLSPTVFLGAQRLVGDALGWAPQHTIQVVNTVAGAVGVVLLVGLARRVAGPARGPTWAAAVALLGCGAVQLLAGYVENYTLPMVCMLGSLTCGLDALAGRRGLLGAFGLWTLSGMFHLSAIVFAPAMAWLAWHAAWGREPRRIFGRDTLRLLSVTLLPSLLLYALMLKTGYHRAEESGFGGGDGRMLVPLFDKGGMSQYLFLRPAHLAAVGNQQLLVAPLGVLLVVAGTVTALRGGRLAAWRAAPQGPGLGFEPQFYLGLAATGFLALTVIWNPDLGALRDWDLFGPVGFYLNLCALALLGRHFGASPARLTVLLAFVAVVNLSRGLPFLLHNAGL